MGSRQTQITSDSRYDYGMPKRDQDPIQASVGKITDIVPNHLDQFPLEKRKRKVKAFLEHAARIRERNFKPLAAR